MKGCIRFLICGAQGSLRIAPAMKAALSRDFRFGSLSGASYTCTAFETTNLSPVPTKNSVAD